MQRIIQIFIKQIILAIVMLTSNPSYSSEKVIFAIDIIRHGDRAPVLDIPKSPINFPVSIGELTALGMNQEYNLGKNLRELYVNHYKLLPEIYTSNSIYVRSSDYNRTLMSAQALLFGLYPLGTGPVLSDENKQPALPNLYQPIPIHTIDHKQDNLLVVHTMPEFKSLWQKHVLTSSEYLDKKSEYKDKMQKWSQITGIELKELQQLVELGDNLFIRQIYGIAMPEGITDQDKDEIIQLGQWMYLAKFAHYEVGYYASKDLRLAISEYLQKASNNNPLKYVLFSAHDGTISALISGMRIPLDTIPPYASCLKILLTHDNSSNLYNIKLNFNGTNLDLPQCKNNNCSLKEFLEIIK